METLLQHLSDKQNIITIEIEKINKKLTILLTQNIVIIEEEIEDLKAKISNLEKELKEIKTEIAIILARKELGENENYKHTPDSFYN